MNRRDFAAAHDRYLDPPDDEDEGLTKYCHKHRRKHGGECPKCEAEIESYIVDTYYFGEGE